MAFDEPETESARLRKDAERLRHDIEWALRRALDPTDVLPMLHRLVRTAKAGSDESVFAHRQLAELIAPRHPWRAALYARRVLAQRPADDRAWAVLAFAQTLLGHYRFAATAYARALGCSPKNPWYAHNLGHLLDVALGRPNDALPWLASAYAAAKDHSELATSYAHALARSGDVAAAKRVLGRAMRESLRTGDKSPSREQTALWRWLERGAPAPASESGSGSGTGSGKTSNKGTNVQSAILPGRTVGHRAGQAAGHAPEMREIELTKTRKRAARNGARPAASAMKPLSALEQTLARGIEHLPLDDRQRGRARALARAIGSRTASRDAESGLVANPAASSVANTAAAIAFSIVDLDEVPLTQAEVAACFRVRVAGLRARYDQLRAELIGLARAEKPARVPVARVTRSRAAGAGSRKVKK